MVLVRYRCRLDLHAGDVITLADQVPPSRSVSFRALPHSDYHRLHHALRLNIAFAACLPFCLIPFMQCRPGCVQRLPRFVPIYGYTDCAVIAVWGFLIPPVHTNRSPPRYRYLMRSRYCSYYRLYRRFATPTAPVCRTFVAALLPHARAGGTA